MKYILLSQPGIGPEITGRHARQKLGHSALHPHVHGEAVCLMKAVEQGALGYLGADALMRSKSISPSETFRAASSIYGARYPERRGARSSRDREATASGEGKAYVPVPGIGSPNMRQKLFTRPLMRLMLLFWDSTKEQRASQGSWRRMRMPGAKAAASARTGLRPESS